MPIYGTSWSSTLMPIYSDTTQLDVQLSTRSQRVTTVTDQF